jgi:putative addiction module component (TIGR02574 family)
MTTSLADIEKSAHALSVEERAKLAESLLASLQGDAAGGIGADWNTAIEQRLAAYDNGEVEVFSAEAVFAEAWRKTSA